jgi:alginate O-acetyltransferase complex protein AlgI
MLFTEPSFLFVFLPAVLFFYFLIPVRSITYRNIVLFLSSIIFYAWGEGSYCLLIILSILVNYSIGVVIANSRNSWPSRLALIIGVSANLCLLVVFKYVSFIAGNINVILAWFGLHAIQVRSFVMPLGVSFFTFQGISYVADVYRGDVEPARTILDVAVFKSFFPQLIAGPIVRFHDVTEQIQARSVNIHDFAQGVRRFIIGLSKKVLIANQVAVPADQIFALSPGGLGPGLAWLGVVCYTFQIYFDFSGYSDMAIGMGRMFGFYFPENFRYPYAARSVTDFWRRWHMSLSSWFRDYLYIPLGGGRVHPLKVYFNLILVFFLCGLWHGASWNFVIWGLFHGAFLVIERIGAAIKARSIPSLLKHGYTLAVVMAGWVFFRTETLEDAAVFFTAMLGLGPGRAVLTWSFLNNLQWAILLIAAFASMPLFPAIRLLKHRLGASLPASRSSIELTAAVALTAIFLVSLSFVAAQGYNPFIYFRF